MALLFFPTDVVRQKGLRKVLLGNRSVSVSRFVFLVSVSGMVCCSKPKGRPPASCVRRPRSRSWPEASDSRLCVCPSPLWQKGPSDLELMPDEYSVMIGPYPCNISFHNDQLFHCTIGGLLSTRETEMLVTVSARSRPPRPKYGASRWEEPQADRAFGGNCQLRRIRSLSHKAKRSLGFDPGALGHGLRSFPAAAVGLCGSVGRKVQIT